uniref:GST N-terminal domain-containing protein n=1 Tax=Globisporangium ultimum (strain ATCC 200006 / CBS 805.95 / DAOM BR144) TaxID=431595 RepID=K3W8Q1_GLOUD
MSDLAKFGVALTLGGAIGAAATSLLVTQKAALATKSATAAVPNAPETVVLPKLYIYDHCPFCVRARMILGLKKVPHELVFLANHDEVTPIGLVGAKQAPILQPPVGKPFPESMDIVRFVDTNYGGSVLLKESANRDDIKQWIKDTAEVFRLLYHPRFHAAVFPEFAQKESREYYRIKKEKTIGPFKDALAKSPELVEEANVYLEKLSDMFYSNRSVNESLSYDDIDLFGRLRGLTLVKGLKWPTKLREYMDYMSEAADVPLLDSMAQY